MSLTNNYPMDMQLSHAAATMLGGWTKILLINVAFKPTADQFLPTIFIGEIIRK